VASIPDDGAIKAANRIWRPENCRWPRVCPVRTQSFAYKSIIRRRCSRRRRLFACYAPARQTDAIGALLHESTSVNTAVLVETHRACK